MPNLPLTFTQLQSINVQRCTKWHTGRIWSLAEWTNALCGEAGEAANIAKKILRMDTGMVGNFDSSRAELIMNLAAELGDTVIYASLIANELGVDLGEVVRMAFNNKSSKLGFEERL